MIGSSIIGKAIPVAIAALVAVGAGWWLVSTIQENELLKTNVATLEQMRRDDAVALATLRDDLHEKQLAAKKRLAEISRLGERLLKAKNDVRVITKEVVTEVERECLEQPVPTAIVNFMLDEGAPSTEN